MPQMEAAC
ncbi:hypothetical protein Nmel_005772 [Mimus melanotis]